MMTKIEWVARPGTTPESWSPVTGCNRDGKRIKASPGCDHCWAERMARRLAGRYGYPEVPHHFDVTLHPDRLEQPLRWKKPRTVFVCSMSDLFHKNVPFSFIDKVFLTVAKAPKHTFLFLTKRAQRMFDYFYGENVMDYLTETGTFWLGVTVENQQAADERIPLLLRTPAAVRFVSCEPLLSPVHFQYEDWDRTGQFMEEKTYLRSYTIDNGAQRQAGLDWIIVGGESGPGARPMHPDWARNIRDQCQAVGVSLHFKQQGTWLPIDQVDHLLEPGQTWQDIGMNPPKEFVFPDGTVMVKVDKRRAGRLLDGREWNEWPNF